MPVRVHLPDGGVANFPDGTPPEEIERALGTVQAPAQQAPRPSADAQPSTADNIRSVLEWGGRALGGALGMGAPGVMSPANAAVENPGATLASAAVPGVLGGMAKYGGPLAGRMASTAAAVLDKPAVGGAIGAAEGYRRGGVEGAVYGGAAGMVGGSQIAKLLKRLAPGMRVPAPTAPRPAPNTTPTTPPAAATATSGASWEQFLGKIPPASPVEPPMSPLELTKSLKAQQTSAAALKREVMLRDPNWRTDDVVPIDAMKRDITKGGSIIEAGESRVGLAEQLANLKLPKDLSKATPAQLAEIDRLQKALRQRMHISAKTGR